MVGCDGLLWGCFGDWFCGFCRRIVSFGYLFVGLRICLCGLQVRVAFAFGFGVVGIVVCCGLASLFRSGVTSFAGFGFGLLIVLFCGGRCWVFGCGV